MVRLVILFRQYSHLRCLPLDFVLHCLIWRGIKEYYSWESTIFLEFWIQLALILAKVSTHAFEEVYLKYVCMIHTKDYLGDNFLFPQPIVDVWLLVFKHNPFYEKYNSL